LNFQTAIVTGIGRSGKSTLGNILATNKNVEYSEEPWLLNLLSAMTELNILDKEVGKDMFTSFLHELMNDMVLLRAANFRPDDGSSIWTKKTPQEILSRLSDIKTRDDVQNFIKTKKPTLLLILRESPLFNLSAIFDFLPKTRIIHVVRSGIDVAYNLEEKGWNSDRQLAKPSLARIFYSVAHKGKTLYIPYWIDLKDAKTFIEYSEYERGLFYWCALMEKLVSFLEETKSANNSVFARKISKQYKTIKFEDLLASPTKVFEEASLFCGMEPSVITDTELRKIAAYRCVCKRAPALPKELLARTQKIYSYFEYDWR